MQVKGKRAGVLQRIRKKKREIDVEWDNQSEGAWHYVPKSKLSILTGSQLEAGTRVSLKWKTQTWLGTVLGKKKTSRTVAVRGKLFIYLLFIVEIVMKS